VAYHNRSSSNCLYSSIRLINYLISLGGLLVNNSHSSESSDNPIRKVLVAIFSLPSLIIVQFPVSVSVAAKGFPSPYFHLKQRVHRLWNSTASHEPYTKLLNQFGKTVNQAFLQPIKPSQSSRAEARGKHFTH